MITVLLGVLPVIIWGEYHRRKVERLYPESDWLKDYMESKGYDWD